MNVSLSVGYDKDLDLEIRVTVYDEEGDEAFDWVYIDLVELGDMIDAARAKRDKGDAGS